jgi:ribonuclease P protein component
MRTQWVRGVHRLLPAKAYVNGTDLFSKLVRLMEQPPAITPAVQPPGESPRTRSTFPRSARLTHDREYDAVYAYKLRKSGVLLAVWVAPSEVPHWRLGLSVSKKTGMAHERVRCKRLVREAFRTVRGTLPMIRNPDLTERGYDLIVSIRSRNGLTLQACRAELMFLVAAAVKEHARRVARSP